MNTPTPMTKLEQIKSESSTRSQRIGKILSTAFTQTSAELKEGYTTVRPLAADLSATAVENLKQTSHQAAHSFKDAWGQGADSTSTWERWQRVLKVVTTAIRNTLTPPLKKQAARVDARLANQYGNSYAHIKQGLQSLKNWYIRSTDPVDSQTQPLTAVPSEEMASQGMTVDVVASPVESKVQ